MEPTRALVAIDDPELSAMVSRLLAEDGMEVQLAYSGSDVLGKLTEGAVDVLVTDVTLPGLGGTQVAVATRSAGFETPILVVTTRREPWIAESVGLLQFASLLQTPFAKDDLARSVRALLKRQSASPGHATAGTAAPHLFPPALVPLVRAGVGENTCLAGVCDETVTELLSEVFFAGLETEEGEVNPVRVVFVGNARVDSEPPVGGLPPLLYRWSTWRFLTALAFSAHELVKLAAATPRGRVFVQVRVQEGHLVISGLAREGVNLEGDPALKIVIHRPGGMSIRMGRYHILDYERGRVSSLGIPVILSGGPVRTALEQASTASGLPVASAGRYLDVVRQLVAKLSAHGSGGILIFSSDANPRAVGESGYETHPGVSLSAMLLRLHRVAAGFDPVGLHDEQLVLGALKAEMQETINEIGALTALDGATILDRSLGLVVFGHILPLGTGNANVLGAQDIGSSGVSPIDYESRGTRHHAAAAYARNHPGSVVFVASKDGDLGCLFRALGSEDVTLWQTSRFQAPDRQAESSPA